MNEPTGYAEFLKAQRDAVLSTARLSRHARARILGKPLYPAPLVRKVAVPPKAEPQPKKRLGLGPRGSQTGRVHDVVAAFCKAFGVPEAEVLSPSHKRQFARPRQGVMHFLYVEMRLSTPRIGRLLDRDHSSIVHGRKNVDGLLREDPEFSAFYHRAVRILRAMWAPQ